MKIDPCWDINGLLKYCKDQLNVSEVIDYLAGPILKHIGTIYDSKNKIRVIHLSTLRFPPRFLLTGISIILEGNFREQWLGVEIFALKD